MKMLLVDLFDRIKFESKLKLCLYRARFSEQFNKQ